ncbi:MAG: cyclic GMP-AMP synthase DncV-like nucleotidyltransferase [Ramlibacter sp.]
MADIDCDGEMFNFHRDKVTLQKAQQDDMRGRRDNGRTRLENGLNEAKKAQPREVRSQGSYQMRTMVQDAENDYDIDDGAYFNSEDFQDDSGNSLTPLAARQRVCDALKWDGRFKQEATVKNNCVRQAYAAGYHIDVPVYRILTTKGADGESEDTFELASGDDWVESDARAVTRWFNGKVGELIAGESDGSQMRRVTKLTKKFSRRPAWKSKTTSGITITKLVVDSFVSQGDRDDKALRETWKVILAKLDVSTEVAHPVSSSKLSQAGDDQVGFFRDCLRDALSTLEALDEQDCNRKNAREAWDKVFDTTFFGEQPDSNGGGDGVDGGGGGGNKGSAMKVTSVETARRNDGGGRFG